MGKDLYLAVGHGRRSDGTFDPGARGDDGRYEHYEATEVVAEAVEALVRSGVSLDHEDHGSAGPEDPNFSGTIRNVNAGDYKLAVEIHFDWSQAPRGGFGHWYSDSGKKIADAVYRHWEAAGLPTRPSWHKRRTDLAFLKQTNPPAMLWECDRVSDYTRADNEKMGEAIARGICEVLGKPFVAEKTVDYAVAVVGKGDVDGILAYLLGQAHAFKVLRYEQVPFTSVGYLLKVGGGAVSDFADREGLDIVGANRYETAQQVLAKIQGAAPDRVRPWA